MSKPNLKAALEALLFIYGEPLTLKRLTDILKVNQDEVLKTIEELNSDLKEESRGLLLVLYDNRVELVTKPELSNVLEDTVRDELNEELTPAALETLAIVAYAGPCTRAYLEYIRGVNSSFILRSLLMRGLIERYLDPQRQNQFLYQPTFELLKHLGIGSREELPHYGEHQKRIEELKKADEENTDEQA